VLAIFSLTLGAGYRYMTLGGLFIDGLELGALLLQMILMTQVRANIQDSHPPKVASGYRL
jgi:hypothetical protein